MLKQARHDGIGRCPAQPPSGGCVLKPSDQALQRRGYDPAAFRRLCVETGDWLRKIPAEHSQPPSGGCVLKHAETGGNSVHTFPAAFRRLCVETPNTPNESNSQNQPPSGGCVLKQQAAAFVTVAALPAAFRRLCVETFWKNMEKPIETASRLQAAVC